MHVASRARGSFPRISRPVRYHAVRALVSAPAPSASSNEGRGTEGLLNALPFIGAALAIILGIKKADNCGIIGVVGGNDDSANTYLMEGLLIMRNRG